MKRRHNKAFNQTGNKPVTFFILASVAPLVKASVRHEIRE
jgi:hypothetical protein